MPHTKLKALSIILIIAGCGSLLAAVCIVIGMLVLGEELIGLLVAQNLSEGLVKFAVLCTIVAYLASGAVELFAGISGIRFAGCSIVNEKVCRIPAIILLVMFCLNIILKVIAGDFGSLVGGLILLAVAGAYFVYVKKVEEYNRTRPSVEDSALFRLRDE